MPWFFIGLYIFSSMWCENYVPTIAAGLRGADASSTAQHRACKRALYRATSFIPIMIIIY